MLSMKMINVAGLIAAAVAVAAIGSPVNAADLGNMGGGSIKDGGYEAPMMRSPVSPCYVRGDVGYSASRKPDASWPVTNETRDYANPSASPSGYTSTYAYAGDTVTDSKLDKAFFGGVGLGCGSGSRGIRGEVMLNHTASRNFQGTPLNYTITNINAGAPPSETFVDPMHTSIKSTTLMFNAYKDLGSFGGITPYLGAGVGVSYNKMDEVSFTDNPYLTQRIQGASRASLAWSLMAGIGYQLNERAILDVGYRYMDYGKAISGVIDSANSIYPAARINDITAHEFKVGLRYHFGATDAAPGYQAMK
jgi:opacity protein-like surface antigen